MAKMQAGRFAAPAGRGVWLAAGPQAHGATSRYDWVGRAIADRAFRSITYPRRRHRRRLVSPRRFPVPASPAAAGTPASRRQSLPPSPQVPLHGSLTRSVCSCMLQPCPVFFHHPQRPSARARATNPPYPPTAGPAVAAAPTSSASPATSATIRPLFCLPFLLLCETSRPNPNILFVFGSESNFKCMCMCYAY